MIKQLKEIPLGGVFYLPQHPGNVYRHVSHGTKAEFVEHRLGNTYRGCEIAMYPQQLVATDSDDNCLEPCTLCGAPISYNVGLCSPCYALVNDETFDHSLL